MRNYKKLEAWKSAMLLVKEVYKLVTAYPKEELFALTSQTKRAAISIPANIAEGMGRQYKKDTLQFLYVARGSVYELETLLNIAVMTGILQKEQFNSVALLIEDVIRLLSGLINYTERAQLK